MASAAGCGHGAACIGTDAGATSGTLAGAERAALSGPALTLALLKLALRDTYTRRSFILRLLLNHFSTRARRSVLDSFAAFSSSVGEPAPGRSGVGVGGGEGCSALRFRACTTARGFTASETLAGARCWFRGEIVFLLPMVALGARAPLISGGETAYFGFSK